MDFKRPHSAKEKDNILLQSGGPKSSYDRHREVYLGKVNTKTNRIIDDNDLLVYLKQNIDPIISPAINYVLKEVYRTNDDISYLFLCYFKKNYAPDSKNIFAWDKVANDEKIKRRQHSVKSLKVSTQIALFVSKIISNIIRRRPDKNIVEVIICIIEEMKIQDNESNTERATLLGTKHVLLSNTTYGVNGDKDSICAGDEIPPIQLNFLLIGLNDSGKTTLVSVLKGQKNPNCKPSLGFRPISLVYKEGVNVKLYDLGGGEKIRGIWENYYHDVHGVIYVVDSSCSDKMFQEVSGVAKSTLGHKFLQGKPLLVISNKIDKGSSRPVDFIRDELNLVISERGMTHLIAVSLHPCHVKNNTNLDHETSIDSALEWLVQKVLTNINELNERIVEDSKEVKLLRIKQQKEKERRIFKNTICRAFALNGESRTDAFGIEEGEDFLAHEIGLAGRAFLPVEGKEVCSLVGNQRFALMMVGKMITTKSTQQKALSWNEVLDYIHSIRSELGI